MYIPVVRSHAAVDHAYVVGDLFNLAGGLVFEQDGFVLLLSGQNHSVHGLDKRHYSEVNGMKFTTTNYKIK
jgi:hypothetical protein